MPPIDRWSPPAGTGGLHANGAWPEAQDALRRVIYRTSYLLCTRMSAQEARMAETKRWAMDPAITVAFIQYVYALQSGGDALVAVLNLFDQLHREREALLAARAEIAELRSRLTWMKPQPTDAWDEATG